MRQARVRTVALGAGAAFGLSGALFQSVTRNPLGSPDAIGLGTRPARVRTAAVILSIVLSAAAVSAAGPIAFIALCAPQIARRCTGAPGPGLGMSALAGALLLVVADLTAQQLPLFTTLPVGIYTMALGGGYLGWLLVREWRRGAL